MRASFGAGSRCGVPKPKERALEFGQILLAEQGVND
jgi:hypothetical protein